MRGEMKVFDKELKPLVIKITFILLFLSTLFPPFIFQPPGYRVIQREWGFLFNPPGDDGVGFTVDILTLLVEW